MLPPPLHVEKNHVSFKVALHEKDRKFWTENYGNWEDETFRVFDKWVKPNSIVLDIGAWIGTTALYCAKLGAKQVIAVEADTESVQVFRENVGLNKLDDVVKIVDKAIYKDDQGVWFGENLFRPNTMNESVSQIVSQDSPKYKYHSDSITFAQLVSGIENPRDISLVKMDIEGGEEFILQEVLQWCYENRVPAFISFHLAWWQQPNPEMFQAKFRDQFKLFRHDPVVVTNSPFASLLFVRPVRSRLEALDGVKCFLYK